MPAKDAHRSQNEAFGEHPKKLVQVQSECLLLIVFRYEDDCKLEFLENTRRACKCFWFGMSLV